MLICVQSKITRQEPTLVRESILRTPNGPVVRSLGHRVHVVSYVTQFYSTRRIVRPFVDDLLGSPNSEIGSWSTTGLRLV